MNRSIKVIIYIVILYLYYRFVFNTRDIEQGVRLILFSALLFMGMKAFKEKQNEQVVQKAHLQAIDQMDQRGFTNYMIRFYKHLGYGIELVGRGRVLEESFIIKKQRKNSLIQCRKLSLEEEVDMQEIDQFIEKVIYYRCSKGVYTTNGFVNEEVLARIKEKEEQKKIHLEMVGRQRLQHMFASLK